MRKVGRNEGGEKHWGIMQERENKVGREVKMRGRKRGRETLLVLISTGKEMFPWQQTNTMVV